MLLNANASCLILVDVQEKLTPLVHESDKFLSHCLWLIEAATMLDIPIIVAEQYPKGLGHTVPALKAALPADTPIISKTTFSCAQDKNWVNQLRKMDRSQIVLMGIETHVCVLQTAIDLLQEDLDVYVVADAVAARHKEDHKYALDRMHGEGVVITTREMVVFEWLKQSDTDIFRKVSKALFKS